MVLGGLLSQPDTSRADPCVGQECGAPECSAHRDLPVRPGGRRELAVVCSRATAVAITQQPAHTRVTDASVEYYGVRLTLETPADAPERETATIVVDGYTTSQEVTVPIRTVPLSENSPPTCVGGEVSERSLGLAPAEVWMNYAASCHDRDGDAFVVEGTGPGEHLGLPMAVAASWSSGNWRYRTVTHAGTEVTTVAATDELGARSEDAEVKVTIGPLVDRLPRCRLNGWGHGDDPASVYTRPGATRRFSVHCEDEDVDPMVPFVTDAPDRGTFTSIVPVLPMTNRWHHWLDVIYEPDGESLEPDPFGFMAAGAFGPGPEARLRLVPREPPANAGASCGWSEMTVIGVVPGLTDFYCGDGDGDPLRVEVVGEPANGSIGDPALVPDHSGYTRILVPYTADPGFEGRDCIRVRITDDYGSEMIISIDIEVLAPLPDALPLPTSTASPALLLASPPPLAGRPEGGSRVPVDWELAIRTYAQQTLGTPAVARVEVLPDVEVWMPKRVSRARLRAEGRAPGMLVLCAGGCTVRSRARIGGATRRTARAAAGSEPQLVWATATRAQLRRARKVRLRVGIERPGARRVVRRALRLG